jgi:hypothetical protein
MDGENVNETMEHRLVLGVSRFATFYLIDFILELILGALTKCA